MRGNHPIFVYAMPALISIVEEGSINYYWCIYDPKSVGAFHLRSWFYGMPNTFTKHHLINNQMRRVIVFKNSKNIFINDIVS